MNTFLSLSLSVAHNNTTSRQNSNVAQASKGLLFCGIYC